MVGNTLGAITRLENETPVSPPPHFVAFDILTRGVSDSTSPTIESLGELTIHGYFPKDVTK